jgi:CRISPR/Cas system CSM-associated protein Csm2 small subunit
MLMGPRKNARKSPDDDIDPGTKRRRQSSPPINSQTMSQLLNLTDVSLSQTTPQKREPQTSRGQPCQGNTRMNQNLDQNPLLQNEIKSLLVAIVKKMDVQQEATSGIRNDLQDIKYLNISTHDRRISNTEVKVDYIESSIEKLEQQNDELRREMSKISLIIDGIPDSATESDDELYSRVKIFLMSIIDEEITFDNAHRLGKYILHHRRPIKIRFMTMLQRNIVYQNRSKAVPPFFINEDLPFATRRDNAILRKKTRDALQSGILADHVKIDYRQKFITVRNLRFEVKNGFLSPGLPIASSSRSNITEDCFLGRQQ